MKELGPRGAYNVKLGDIEYVFCIVFEVLFEVYQFRADLLLINGFYGRGLDCGDSLQKNMKLDFINASWCEVRPARRPLLQGTEIVLS